MTGCVDTRGKTSVQSSVTTSVPPPAAPDLSLVIPAYDEAARLPRTLNAVADFLRATRPNGHAELLVVDDGSRDDTARAARAWAEAHCCAAAGTAASGGAAPFTMTVLGYPANRGKGYAVRFGVLRASGERILFMDADLSTPMTELAKVEAALDVGGASIAIGSRPLRESRLLVRQPWYRELCGRGFNQAVQLLAMPGLHDTQCGFKLFTRQAAHDVFGRCVLDGFSFDVEALFLARRLGYKIAEVPVAWAHQEGSSAFPTKAAWLRGGLRMLRDIARIRWMHGTVRPLAAANAPAAPPPWSA